MMASMKLSHKHAKASIGGIPFIPLHIVKEILLRLDARTLFRCAFVCREWNALITSPDFVCCSSERNFDSRNQVLFIKVCPCQKSAETYEREYVYFPYCRLTYSLHWDNDEFDLIRTIKNPAINDFKGTEVIGISNGLVCLANKLAFKFILWNPSIQKYVWLPRALPWDGKPYSVGFGFNRNSNDFKIVNLVHRYVDEANYVIDSAWVFSYITWSWKRVTYDNSIPPCYIRPLFPHLFFNGVLHWTATTATETEECYDFILTFDLTLEVFGKILLPPSIGTDFESWNSILTTGDSLLVTQEKRMLDDEIDQVVPCVFSMWIMEQYGNQESWTNIFSETTEVIDPVHILGARKNGELIVEMEGGQIRRYNPTTSTDLPLRDMQSGVFFCYYTESLYLLEKGEDVNSY
ncbi:hypothetical protein K1719_009727 [Acacia pycnantha]|nr:hypothetical protein K1719_009727 [Acacia pycnantha]